MPSETYSLLHIPGQPDQIVCGFCGYKSANVNDVKHRYCIMCHVFHDVVAEARAAHATGATHDCGEWRTAAGRCAICDRALPPAEAP